MKKGIVSLCLLIHYATPATSQCSTIFIAEKHTNKPISFASDQIGKTLLILNQNGIVRGEKCKEIK